MPIYAVAETVPDGVPQIVAGKRYEVLREEDGGFYCLDESGNAFYAQWRKSTWLNFGDWTRIDEPPINHTFWQQVYIAAIRAGHDEPWNTADLAVKKLEGRK